jgi:hypothetical protein
MNKVEAWPTLPWEAWKDTCETLHMCTQIVGKTKLALSPFLNQWWQVGFEVSARGLTTSAIPTRRGIFEIELDFVDHHVRVATSEGERRTFRLSARPVRDFYGELMATLRELDIDVAINPLPVEVPNPIRCDEDRTHISYDPEYVQRWWRILLGTTKVLQRYRSTFVGKSSPVLFYWGSFDLNATRFSGRPAPRLEGVPRFFQLAEDQENIACGFWPGNATAAGVTLGEPAFYSYIYPAPAGYREAAIRPAAARFEPSVGEYILPYEEARRSPSPEETILEFFRSAYDAGADRARWDRAALERVVA